MKFRHDINALRAIAVIGVVLFHFKVPFFDGGFSGVDIFYVISGFLMTSIVMKSLESKTFSLGEFYMKRVKRIIPALLFLVISLLVIGFFLYLPKDYQMLTKNATASLLFVSNILYWKDSDYFHPSSETNIFLHTWSLSVEWQFYLILPIVIALAHRFFLSNKTKYFLFFSAITTAIFVVSIWYNKKDPSASFYLLPTRSWEMLAGGIAVFIAPLKNQFLRKGISLASYAVLIGCVVMLHSHLRWPGIYTSIPVAATFFIIVADCNEWSILQNKFVQLAGKLSYSLYLWHWPVFVIASYLGIKQGVFETTGLLAISIALAYISYHYVESVKFEGRKILLNTACFAIIASGFAFIEPNKLLFGEKTLSISNYEDLHASEKRIQFGTDSCFVSSKQTGLKDFDPKYCLDIKTDRKNFLLIGDSHAAHFSQSMREALEKQNIHLIQASATGCLPLINKNGQTQCSEIIEYIYKIYLPNNYKDIDGVIISANWIKIDKSGYSKLKKNLTETVRYLDKLHLKSVIIGQTETYTIPFPSIVAREYQYDISFSDQFITSEADEMNQFLSKEFGDFYIDIYKTVNSERLSSNEIPYMFDQNHFTKYGADKVISNILANKTFEAFLNRPNEELIGSIFKN